MKLSPKKRERRREVGWRCRVPISSMKTDSSFSNPVIVLHHPELLNSTAAVQLLCLLLGTKLRYTATLLQCHLKSKIGIVCVKKAYNIRVSERLQLLIVHCAHSGNALPNSHHHRFHVHHHSKPIGGAGKGGIPPSQEKKLM